MNTSADACPDLNQWYGPTAQAYSDLNLAQQDLIKAISTADSDIVDALTTQADMVTLGRELLLSCRLALAGGIIVANSMCLPYRALIAAAEFEEAATVSRTCWNRTYTVATAATAGALAVLSTLIETGFAVGKKVHDAADDYRQAVNGADEIVGEGTVSGGFTRIARMSEVNVPHARLDLLRPNVKHPQICGA